MQKFTVIDGGLIDKKTNDLDLSTTKKELVNCYITNTRLMGVVGMYIHFHLPDHPDIPSIHQFFYFDAEEYGFETYRSIKGDNLQEVAELSGAIFGGLGGEKRQISLVEARYLLQFYVDYNKAHSIPLPPGLKEYEFLIKARVELSDPDKYILMSRLCVKPQNHYEVINYFLMRCFGKDFRCADFLAKPGVARELFPEFHTPTFYKNSVDESADDGTILCTSLVESRNDYYLVVTKLTMDRMTVTSFERVSSFKVSSFEAALLLSKVEYVSIFKRTDASKRLRRITNPLTEGATIKDYPSGKLFMVYHPNNNHVARQEYRLSNDVKGTYFDIQGGDILCAAYTLKDIAQIEYNLMCSPLGSYLVPGSKYEFHEPILFEFVQGDFNDFDEFVDLIGEEEK